MFGTYETQAGNHLGRLGLRYSAALQNFKIIKIAAGFEFEMFLTDEGRVFVG